MSPPSIGLPGWTDILRVTSAPRPLSSPSLRVSTDRYTAGHHRGSDGPSASTFRTSSVAAVTATRCGTHTGLPHPDAGKPAVDRRLTATTR
jgi:hypothetical protein